ncbi:MAG: Glucose-6-phosphate isomerase [Phycisphaerae bacterium]|nr:Glucose-6-phosphate isomerase [Phycisphaerae bacterium]
MPAKNQKLITLEIKSLQAKSLGPQALTAKELNELAPRVKKMVQTIERERQLGRHRYRDLPYDKLMIRQVRELAKFYRPKVNNLVVLGIGGSALGNIALQQALNHPYYNLLDQQDRSGPRLFVMDNVDPTLFAGLLDLIGDDLPRTLFNVISKSGETAETASQYLIVRDLLIRKLGSKKAAGQILATTDAHSGTLRTIAQQEGYNTLPVPDGVGGRFSVLSAVGLFSAALCGIDIEDLMHGAAAMDQQVKQTALLHNPAALFAAVNYLYYQRGRVMSVMMPYSNALYSLADWFRQLWAESLGKRYDAAGTQELFVGPTPIKALGSTDQHSQVQLYREGPQDKLITLLEVDKFDRDIKIAKQLPKVKALAYLGGATLGQLLQAEKQGTELALLASARPCLTIRFPRLTPYTIGQFIYLMEAATTIAGSLFNVNPYDQPGVELGKKITYHLMGKKGYEKMPRD